MKSIVFIGAHLGYPMDRTPLGGGAMVGLHLIRDWAARGDVRLLVMGPGPESPEPSVEYVRLPAGPAAPELVRLSELEYAAFCRRFEAETTEHLLGRRSEFEPKDTVVFVNDIAESPDVTRIAGAGYRVVSLWHVDVVDYFNRLYLKEVVRPERLTRLFERLRRRGLAGLLPDMLRLIFEKQRRAVQGSDLLVVPSRQMAEALERCYPAFAPRERVLVLPWGVWRDDFPEDAIEAEAARLRRHYQLKPDSLAVMTLSRISPEKGLHILVEALRLLEDSGRLPGRDVCLFACGEAAFMRGKTYAARVRRAAERLRRFRVFFPGYLPAFEKRAYLRLARLFVSPSIHESYGLTLVEALQAGVPALASDHYGVRESLRPEYGRAVPYRNPGERAPALAAALEEMLSDEAALRGMGLKAREAAEGMKFERTSETLLERALGLLEPAG